MKITCQSCQSKYNVADEKVQGKVVKIRCRKCGSTIVVNGAAQGAVNGSAAAAVSAPTVPDAAKGEAQVWHVNITEDEQRTMSLGEIADAYGAGLVTRETFIWSEGMEDWRPLGEVDAVASALNGTPAAWPGAAKSNRGSGDVHENAADAAGSSQGTLASEDDPTDGSDATRVFHGSGQAAPHAPHDAAFGEFGATSMPLQADPKRAAVRREARSRDLFASRVSADEVQAGQESAAGGALLQMTAAEDIGGRRLGERNENSVLFSLAVLTKTAESRPLDGAASSGADDDSGLIDLKALAAKTESLRPGGARGDAAVFSAPLGAMPPLGAPLGTIASSLGDGPGQNRLRALVAGGALLALLLVAGIAIGVKWAGTHAPVAASAALSAPVAPSQAAGAAVPTAPSAMISSSPRPPAASASAPASAPSPAAPVVTRYRASGGAWHPQNAAKPAGAEPPAQAAPAKKAGGDCGCNGDLMCLMKCSTH